MKQSVRGDDGTASDASIAEVECVEASPAQFDLAMRTLARLLVRAHVGKGDPAAIVGGRRPTSDLTVVPHPSPHPDDEAA